MIASLGMYDRAETSAANDRFWALIRDNLRDAGESAPDALTRGADAYWTAWQSAELSFSQTCGFPYRARLQGQVTLIGAPDYGVEGCPAGHYASVYVARRDDARDLMQFDGALLAYNEGLSQSGWAAPQNHAAELGIGFRIGAASGGHALSARAVAEGDAEIAALDAVTWQLLQRHEPMAAALREVGRTPPTPALPYITAAGRDGALYFAAVKAAIADLPPQDRETLCLKGIVALTPADYLGVPTPPTPAEVALRK